MARCGQRGGVQRDRTGDAQKRKEARSPAAICLPQVSSADVPRIRRKRSTVLSLDQGTLPPAPRPRNEASCGTTKTCPKLDQNSVPRLENGNAFRLRTLHRPTETTLPRNRSLPGPRKITKSLTNPLWRPQMSLYLATCSSYPRTVRHARPTQSAHLPRV